MTQVTPPAEYVLLETGTVLGRGVTATVRVDDPSISREHARILRQGQIWQIMDLGSANGTLVNNMPVRGVCRLNNGDMVKLGGRNFCFHCEEDSTPNPNSTISGATFLSIPESRQVVFLVADLKGFTPLSTRLDSATLASAVRYWCDECRRILEAHGAVLDKFIGDCAFAWWPGRGPVVREQAVKAALALLQIAPLPDALLQCGVALHCGEAALCRMPDASFTLLGAEVNTTFRMESLTRQLEKNLLVSEAFVSDWPEAPFSFTECGCHSLKGIPAPVRIYAVDPAPTPCAGSAA